MLMLEMKQISLSNWQTQVTIYPPIDLIIQDDLPELWSATIETSDVNNPSIVSNLTPAMADHPITGDAHISNVTLWVTTDPQAPADTMQPLTIRVEDRDSGELFRSTLCI